MNSKTSVAPSVMWVAAEGGASTLLSIISLFVMAHVVGPTSVGVFALAFGIVDMVNLIVEFLFQDALIQRDGLTPEHEHTAFTTAVVLGLVSFASLALAAGPLAQAFAQPELQPVLTVTASTLLFTGLISVPTAQLRRSMQFRVLSIRTIAARVTGAILGPALALLGCGVWSFVAQHYAAVLISTLLILPRMPARPRLSFRWAHFREMIVFALPIAMNGLANLTQSRMFPVLVGLYQGTAAVGFINMAFRTAETAREMLAIATHSIGLSFYARQQRDLPGLKRSLYQSTQMLCLAAQPIFGGMIIVANDFVTLVLGDAWLPIVPLIQMLAATTMLRLLVFQNEVVVVALGRPILMTAASCFSLAIVLTGMLVVQPRSEIVSMAIWIAPQICTVPFWLVATGALTRSGAWAQLRPGLPALFCTIAMIALVTVLEATLFAALSGGAALAAKVASGAVGYLALTLLFNRSTLSGLIALMRTVLLGGDRNAPAALPVRVPEST